MRGSKSLNWVRRRSTERIGDAGGSGGESDGWAVAAAVGAAAGAVDTAAAAIDTAAGAAEQGRRRSGKARSTRHSSMHPCRLAQLPRAQLPLRCRLLRLVHLA